MTTSILSLDDQPYFIAEVGQNHQGSVSTAIEYIHIFAAAGADAIKFQARHNKSLFSENAYNASYNSENAFAETYGAHREYLELDINELANLRDECHTLGVAFMCTPFEEESLKSLIKIDVDILKVSSFDIGNLPLIYQIARTQKPVVMSVGGANDTHIEKSVEAILKHHNRLILLHCVSEYPCPHDRLGLSAIPELASKYSNLKIGLSDHFNGILSGPIAYMMGARVFEKHVTTNRSQKGTDHGFALEPEGFRKFVRDVKRVPEMMTKKPQADVGNEEVFKKLGKSLCAAIDLNAGQELSLNNLTGKIYPDTFIPVRECHQIIGKKVNKTIPIGNPITFDDLI